MTIKQFIEKAIEGGWVPKYPPRLWQNGVAEVRNGFFGACRVKFYRKDGTVGTKYWHIADTLAILLDPLAWQAVGKVEGWEDVPIRCGSCHTYCNRNDWRTKMIEMTEYLIQGKTIEEFLKTL